MRPDTRSRRRGLATAAVLACLLVPATAAADATVDAAATDDTAASRSAAGGEAAVPAVRVHVGVVGTATFEGRVNTAHWGGAIAGSMALVPGKLELVGMARLVTGDDGTTLPVSVLLRRPIGISRTLQPYVGGGVVAAPGLGRGARDLTVGLASALGASVFLGEGIGVFAEADVDLLATRRLTPALGLAGGVAIAF